MVKLLTTEKGPARGAMYSFNASSISHDEGVEDEEKSENVRWYVEAYLKARVVRLSRAAFPAGVIIEALPSCEKGLPLKRYDMDACS